jgi:hypothetical protein
MRCHARALITASPEAIWSVLTDGARYPDWEPATTRIDGTITDGGQITVHTKLSKQSFPVTVHLQPSQHTMTWEGGLPLGLFRGVRTFALSEPDASGQVTFTVEEVFSGSLLFIMRRLLPDLQPSFDAFAETLKRTCEA